MSLLGYSSLHTAPLSTGRLNLWICERKKELYDSHTPVGQLVWILLPQKGKMGYTEESLPMAILKFNRWNVGSSFICFQGLGIHLHGSWLHPLDYCSTLWVTKGNTCLWQKHFLSLLFASRILESPMPPLLLSCLCPLSDQVSSISVDTVFSKTWWASVKRTGVHTITQMPHPYIFSSSAPHYSGLLRRRLGQHSKLPTGPIVWEDLWVESLISLKNSLWVQW